MDLIVEGKVFKKQPFFFYCSLMKTDSFMWKGILSTKTLICMGHYFKLGVGSSISPWSDPWIPGIRLKSFTRKERVAVSNIFSAADLRQMIFLNGILSFCKVFVSLRIWRLSLVLISPHFDLRINRVGLET